MNNVPSPSAGNTAEERLVDMEVKLAFTEDLLEELNRAAFRQQQQIDQLQQEIRTLRQQLATALPAEPRNAADDVPPHY